MISVIKKGDKVSLVVSEMLESEVEVLGTYSTVEEAKEAHPEVLTKYSDFE